MELASDEKVGECRSNQLYKYTKTILILHVYWHNYLTFFKRTVGKSSFPILKKPLPVICGLSCDTCPANDMI